MGEGCGVVVVVAVERVVCTVVTGVVTEVVTEVRVVVSERVDVFEVVAVAVLDVVFVARCVDVFVWVRVQRTVLVRVLVRVMLFLTGLLMERQAATTAISQNFLSSFGTSIFAARFLMAVGAALGNCQSLVRRVSDLDLTRWW